ncbi:C6 zinc finger domain protein [Aspergillus sclerotiicarbonarius CBS 121057]|uniref:C6 zinc finger domain protein n=1 Tax=Aspergillus sclerotiicarbonarius (strain CBS 121057 / IBT 28362) TaxID=1448318 RepID=A0A319ET65_ASPSB|nr:C6 zinc finger domain protein [Aspergillus sclerotiicarbonarius CBS 121057]
MGSEDPEQPGEKNGVPEVAVTPSKAARPTLVRKKFAKPPVKVACLACRASRTRCDGQDPCTNCASKSKICSYLPSKRGGPRKKKKTSTAAELLAQQDDGQNGTVPPVPSGFDDSAGMFGQIDVLSIPGAGLRSLDFPSDVHAMFADLFVPSSENNAHGPMEPTPSPSNIPSRAFVRTYGSEDAILNAYYDFVHNYFPILPPRVDPQAPDRPLDCVGSFTETPSEEPMLVYRPRSPLSLAISAIMALVPHPNDLEPSSPTSVIRRRTFAHTFAQMANAAIETDCELHASSTYPSEALSNERPLIDREPLHRQTPVELESLLALLVLSIYEYNQRGNLLKMRYRAGQALAIALDMSLHSLGEECDEFAEARRRAWWMTYYCVLQGSIVSTTPLAIVANDPQFVTPYPRFSADPDGWSVLIQAQQVLVSATQFIIDLNKCLSTKTNMPYIFERMQQLDAWASSALAQSNLLPIVPQSMACGGEIEFTTAQSIRAISRIKLSSAQIKVHRFRAFSDIPIFIKKHCDLTSASSNNPMSNSASKNYRSQSGIANIGCSCSLGPFEQTPSDYASSSSSVSSDLQPISQYPFASGFPYSIQHSAKMCLRASLLISRMFYSLPLPQPLLDNCPTQQGLPMLPNQLPRTMPSFACCLMQGSYAMLMIYYKARVEKQMSPDYGNDSTPNPSDRLIEEIRKGLERIIATVTNYAIAFEALDGMRDEIAGAYHTAFSQA